jgi:glycerol-3-phosphate dehydrogenase
MIRDLSSLAEQRYDLVVVGAGIYGACVAWDAALRGLKVALLEKGDFGHGTSANSLKIIHGGLRYLQDGDVRQARVMARERGAWLRLAPHLVQPLPCLLPTGESLARSRPVVGAALALNRLISAAAGAWPGREPFAGSRLVSRAGVSDLLPGLALPNLTGAALWYDGLMYNSERLLLSFVLSATALGAAAANYVEVTGFLRRGNAIRGVCARDVLSGRAFDVRAPLVVNCAGSWAGSLLARLEGAPGGLRLPLSLAMNLVTRQWWPGYAVAVRGICRADNRGAAGRPHTWFVVPWREYSLVGTRHVPLEGRPEDFRLSEEHIADFLADLNESYPAARLERQDVVHVHYGFLPTIDPAGNGRLKLLRHGQVYDHKAEQGIEGLITLVGVKYTAARLLAEKAVDLAVSRLARLSRPCATESRPLCEGDTGPFSGFMEAAVSGRSAGIPADMIRHLVHNYGTGYGRILAYGEVEPALLNPLSKVTAVTAAEVVHAVRHEMAQTLVDVVRRRTELGAAGLPGPATLRACAAVMAAEKGWNSKQTESEIEAVHAAYSPSLRPAEGGRD